MDKKFESRYKTFVKDRKAALLNDHQLTGNMSGYRSFSITGDIRVVYREFDDGFHFMDIGSHSQVYGKNK